MLGGRLVGQFFAEEEVRGESHPTLEGEQTSCRAAPWQEMGGGGGGEERKRGEEHGHGRAGRSVVALEEGAWMTQAAGFLNQRGRRGETEEVGEREGEADMQATAESGNTPTFVT